MSILGEASYCGLPPLGDLEGTVRTMQIMLDTPLRIEVSVEKDKSDCWLVVSYLATGDGQKKRRVLATCEAFDDATRWLGSLWRRQFLDT